MQAQVRCCAPCLTCRAVRWCIKSARLMPSHQQSAATQLIPCMRLAPPGRCKQLMEILPGGGNAVYRLLKLLNQVGLFP